MVKLKARAKIHDLGNASLGLRKLNFASKCVGVINVPSELTSARSNKVVEFLKPADGGNVATNIILLNSMHHLHNDLNKNLSLEIPKYLVSGTTMNVIKRMYIERIVQAAMFQSQHFNKLPGMGTSFKEFQVAIERVTLDSSRIRSNVKCLKHVTWLVTNMVLNHLLIFSCTSVKSVHAELITSRDDDLVP